MSPLSQHGRDAHVIASIITTLLDYLQLEYDAFTPVTMELPQTSEIEPDYCFYIDNWQAISGKQRINWTIDPPPDLVLEIDVTSYTDVNDYLSYKVPEIWLYKQKQLLIYQLQESAYILHSQSRYFPNLDLPQIVQQCLNTAYNRNTSTAIRELKKLLNQ
jgi:Uma2 family endonuclease